MNKNHSIGFIMPTMLVVIGVFTIIIYALANLVANQYLLTQRQTATEQSLQIAEAGINYYRWHLAHSPNDFTDGTGHAGPYVHAYSDPQGGTQGHYSITITAPQSGSTIISITSSGSTDNFPDIRRTITAQYGKPSMAQYVFLHNSNIWLGNGLEIFGPVHSNGGIRQDGINHSKITSSLDTYTCGSETGCFPSQTKNAVWGAGGDQGLWDFPQTPVDFDAIGIDFATMKTAAQTTGTYLNSSNTYGYHVVFNSNQTVSIYKVTNAANIKGYDTDTGCVNLYQSISSQSLVSSYNQSTKNLIFAEDNVWVDGTITSPVQVVAAKFPLETNAKNIWLTNNLQYSNTNGTIQAGLIAQNDIIFGRNVPNSFTINGALLAKDGRIIRHHYNYSGCSTSTSAIRNSLTIYGALISSKKSYWNWGDVQSGFTTRNVSYDANLLYSPPPYFPTTGEYSFINWTE